MPVLTNVCPTKGDHWVRGDSSQHPSCKPWEKAALKTKVDAAGLSDLFRHFHPKPSRSDATWRDDTAELRIDHHWLQLDKFGKKFKINKCEVLREFGGSDHYAVFAEFVDRAAGNGNDVRSMIGPRPKTPDSIAERRVRVSSRGTGDTPASFWINANDLCDGVFDSLDMDVDWESRGVIEIGEGTNVRTIPIFANSTSGARNSEEADEPSDRWWSEQWGTVTRDDWVAVLGAVRSQRPRPYETTEYRDPDNPKARLATSSPTRSRDTPGVEYCQDELENGETETLMRPHMPRRNVTPVNTLQVGMAAELNVEALWDSGADECCMTKSVLDLLKMKVAIPPEQSPVFQMANGNLQGSLGGVHLTYWVGKTKLNHLCLVNHLLIRRQR